MKKTLIALAAIAAVSSAMADVTISGYFDRALIAKNSTDGTASTNTIASGAGTTGLFFKGNEKLSSDLSGIFQIETDFLDLAGASQTATQNYANQNAGFANGELFIGLPRRFGCDKFSRIYGITALEQWGCEYPRPDRYDQYNVCDIYGPFD